MPTPEEIQAEIDHLKQLLSSGATSITSDGETVKIDPDQIRRRLSELQSQLTGRHYRQRRVRTFDIRNA